MKTRTLQRRKKMRREDKERNIVGKKFKRICKREKSFQLWKL
jgi:hypothetical protein